ncbi:MAG: glycosyltransferase family 2 protein [Pseudosphingobacterium sp.]|nr:glycosyltransferase family 2 protein [Olivibacter sp. UJ_SKK_5.1]MDX3912685.1 glycosyltransferase family 2 protein [Pseudosphingobacterium sp.]
MTENIAIIILNYKNYEDTITCIDSILRSDNSGYTIFVVDNASNNESLKRIQEAFTAALDVLHYDQSFNSSQIKNDKTLLLVQHNKNAGYAAGNNVGLRLATSLGFKYSMVLNNDTIFNNTDLSRLKFVLDTKEDALVVGPLLFKEDGIQVDYNCAKRRPTYFDFFRLSYFGQIFKTDSWKRKYYYLFGRKNLVSPVEVDLISGSCMMFNAEKLHRIDYYDEATFLYYEEDILCEKARRQGYKFYFQPQTSLIHLGAKTMKNHSHSEITLRSSYDSALYYLTKWRRTPKLFAKMILLSKYLFMELYLMKKKIASR